MTYSSISDLWNKWNIRGFVLLSLSFQVFLILFAPCRKKIANRSIVFLLCYIRDRAHLSPPRQFAFWASFLLLHLGGPDTITAFSLEDSSLWKRHLLNLIFQVGVAIYLFVRIFPSDKSLVIPTMLVFLAGVIKNAERTLALNLSSLPRLKESMAYRHKLRSHARLKLQKEVEALGPHGHPGEEEAKHAESTVVKHAYLFFQIFKIFVGDLMFNCDEREMSRKYFYEVSAMDALRIISVELQFIYEVLHTKALAIRTKWSYIFRFVAFIDVAVAFVLFNRLKKHGIPKLDVEITYSLLFGGMALDVIALFMLVFSDWTVGGIKCFNTRSSKLASVLHKLISAMDDLRKPQFTKCKAEPNANSMYAVLDTPFIFRRWSESISACNLLSESLKESPRKMYKDNRSWGISTFSNKCCFLLRMAEKIISYFQQANETIAGLCGLRPRLMIANMNYVSKNPFIKELWIFIFKEVKRKSGHVDVKEIFEARGDWFLRDTSIEIISGTTFNFTDINYDSSIISWHIVTEIWYNQEKPTVNNEKKEFSKILSDYMLYLLLNQHNMVSAVAGVAQTTSADTLAKFSDLLEGVPMDIKELCERLYAFRPEEIRSPSVLGMGIGLAKEMERLEEKKWEVMSGVWVEMLSYAAGHIKGEAHVQVLSNGGELLAFVWLLLAHFGLLYKPGWGPYYEDSSRGRDFENTLV
ncbi:hypothetical protein BT93_D1176 [Corymbia citriodora subsp. variegata]|nr:hypothetical protein BT93_D1176 [Corymbia citriodora subsp. variegata]